MTRRRGQIDGAFATRLIEMLCSPACKCLSLSARRCLDRIEIEHSRHGGRENGRLPVTYRDFEEHLIDRHAIAPALRELEALGFLEITEQGRAGNAEWRRPNKFRLTFAYGDRGNPPTHEWRRIKSAEEASALAKAARAPLPKKRRTLDEQARAA